MSRPIKFRAWDGSRFYKPYVHGDGSIFRNERDIEDYIPCKDELTQFTGLHDKNGKPIYEGDFIHYESYGKYLIKWDDECACFYTDLAEPCLEPFMSTNLLECNDSGTLSYAEVIGNIYETPELLEGEL